MQKKIVLRNLAWKTLKELQISQLQGKRDQIPFCKDCSAPMVCCDENLDNHTDKLVNKIST